MIANVIDPDMHQTWNCTTSKLLRRRPRKGRRRCYGVDGLTLRTYDREYLCSVCMKSWLIYYYYGGLRR
jgi:hypothetical protein